MTNKILVAISLLLSTSAFAYDSNTTYDYKTGNQYNVQHDDSGNTTTHGTNFNTGSTWTTTTDKSGNESGTDKKGNNWNYNAGSGNYTNYGTGKFCTGKGAYRVCN